MACTNPQNPTCPNCNKSGLAILPVRYAVIPHDVTGALPQSLGNKVTNVVIAKSKYALRTLRQGFIYLLHEKHPRGSQIKWEVYSVSAGGTLWKQISHRALESISDEPACARKGHNIPASVITIQAPEKCRKVWIAFSEHAWSEDTLNTYEKDSALRERRMQTFLPATWIKSQGYKHGIQATQANIETVIEYQSVSNGARLAGSGITNISQPDGTHNPSTLSRQCTRYPVCMRREQSANLVEVMKKVGEQPDGEFYPPVVLALWDAVGITHELNGFRNDAAGFIKKYSQERELQISALAAIDGVKKFLEARAAQSAQANAELGTFRWTSESTAGWADSYAKRNPGSAVSRERHADLCSRWEQDSTRKIPESIAKRREHGLNLSEAEWQKYMSRIDNEAAQWYVPRDGEDKSAIRKLQDSRKRSAIAAAWPKYQAHLDQTALDKFRSNYRLFLDTAASLIDVRTEDNIAWIESKSLLDSLTEFHPQNIEDGVAFEDAVGDMVFGISSSPVGAKKIESWVREAKASESNLLWRSIAVNQAEGVTELNAVLAVAQSYTNTPFTESALTAARESTKHLAKIADLAKKSLSLHNTLRKDGVRRIPTGGVEKIFMTVGDRFFQPFMKKGADLLSEKFVQSLLLARAGADYSKIMGLMMAEAKFGLSGRAETLMALSMGHVIATKQSSQAYKSLHAVWEDLALHADTPKKDLTVQRAGAFNEAKELRFGMAATLLQGVFAVKLAQDVENAPKNRALANELLAARLSFGSGLADLGATAIKGLNTAKDAAVSFQALKLFGGVLSAGAAWASVTNDISNTMKNARADNYAVAYMYGAKAFLNFAGGSCSALTAVSYTKPVLEHIARRFPNTILGRAGSLMPRLASAAAARLLIGRALLMTAGLWASVGVVAVEILIYFFLDDELEKWCARCAFGTDVHHRLENVQHQLKR